MEWFIAGTQPSQYDTIYHPVVIDSASGRLADDSTPPARRTEEMAYDLPPQAANWAASNHLLLYSSLLNNRTAQPSPGSLNPPLSILSPADRTVYMLAPGLSPSAQSIQIQAAAADGLSQVSLWLDGNLLTRFSAPPYQLLWQLAAGPHELWAAAVEPNGTQQESAHVHFEVKK